MKIALSSASAIGAWFVIRLMAEGHKVDYYLSNSKAEGVLSGLIPRPKVLDIDQRRHVLGYGFPNYYDYDLSLFDFTGQSKQADSSRASLVPTLGDGYFENLLEDDRQYGIEAMEFSEIKVPPYERFDSPDNAKAFLRKRDRRYVFKPFVEGGRVPDSASTYVSRDSADMLRTIDKLFSHAKGNPFILQEFVTGTEVSVEGWFNGTDFSCLCGTLEEKKFLNDNKGPNTGCAGVLVFTLSPSSRLYEETLKKTIPLLKNAGFRGVIDLNTIVAEGGDKIFGLEWGPRLGYLCCPVSSVMYGPGYADFILAVAKGAQPQERWQAPFGAAITVSIPPYPTEILIPSAEGIPIEGLDPCSPQELCEFFLHDARLDKTRERLETCGHYGYIGAPIGYGGTLEESFAMVERKLQKLHIPNMQYRTDIRARTLARYGALSLRSWL